MPTYDYRCEENQKVVEVRHSMNEKMQTWGEVCEKAGIELGETPSNAIVVRVISSFRINNSEPPRFDPSILPK